jgi:hypothetical protein
MKCLPKACKPVKKVKEEDRAVHENGSTKSLAILPTARREGSKGTGKRTEKKQRELSLDKPPVFERGHGNTFLKKFGHCTLKIGRTSKIHVFRFYLPVQYRSQHAVPAENQSL